jgi:hypothetical protein
MSGSSARPTTEPSFGVGEARTSCTSQLRHQRRHDDPRATQKTRRPEQSMRKNGTGRSTRKKIGRSKVCMRNAKSISMETKCDGYARDGKNKHHFIDSTSIFRATSPPPSSSLPPGTKKQTSKSRYHIQRMYVSGSHTGPHAHEVDIRTLTSRTGEDNAHSLHQDSSADDQVATSGQTDIHTYIRTYHDHGPYMCHIKQVVDVELR